MSNSDTADRAQAVRDAAEGEVSVLSRLSRLLLQVSDLCVLKRLFF